MGILEFPLAEIWTAAQLVAPYSPNRNRNPIRSKAAEAHLGSGRRKLSRLARVGSGAAYSQLLIGERRAFSYKSSHSNRGE